ncbi:MAG: DUF2914 domain-containing protein [Desulfobacteraceae bacterium]|nr:MAG: DUF2914 domain-containing protein [Desulfobacteraceae bacterium]
MVEKIIILDTLADMNNLFNRRTQSQKGFFKKNPLNKPACRFVLLCALILTPVFYAQADQPQKTFSIPTAGNPLGRSMMCENIIDNHPLNETVLFSIAKGKAVCFSYMTRVSKKIVLFHNWYKADKLSSRFPLSIEPLQGFTWSKIELRESDQGPWRVEITDESGNLLKILRFSITD